MPDRRKTGGLASRPLPALHLPVLLLAMATLPVRAQVHWLDKFDGAQACHIVDVALDAAGNAYVIGDLSSTTTVSRSGAVLTTLPTAGGPDVLVAKFTPDGSLAWAQHAGGPAVDLGLKLVPGPAGLAITGVFSGSADLFGIPVAAQGGSTDLFVALLDPADGQAQWVRTAGSPGYTDTPGGITMNSAGDIIVAGTFKGDAVFGPNTLHSATDPSTGLPGFDVFIAAWSASGGLQWVKQGTGPKDCSAVDIACGPDDQLYVAGQFSETITFDLVHPGTVLNGSGWYTVHSDVSLVDGGCSSGPFSFTFTDSVYVEVGNVPSITFTSYEVQRCANDTVMLPFTCTGCDSIIWSGPGVAWTSPHGDTVLVDQDGTYFATPLSLAGSLPCIGTAQAVGVTSPVPPPLYLEPADGIVCPDDSVLLFTTVAGTAYNWTGPGTAFLPDAGSIWVDEPGDYYLSVTLYPGCSVSDGPATISFLGSPVITGPPGGILCPGGSVQLQVDAGPGGVLQWQPPLSGSSPVQTVAEPGTYSCTVLSCGTPWDLSFDVVASTVNASLGADTFALCQNLPITLTAPAGAAGYQWLPSGATGPQLEVNTPGSYELIATDAGGCTASSGPITVVLQEITEPASAFGASLCAGQSATLTGSGSGDLFWYASPDGTGLLATGGTWTVTPAATDTVFLLQVENGCPGAPVPVVLAVQEPPAMPVITGDSVACAGDTLLLTAYGAAGSTFAWMTPGGPYDGNPLWVPGLTAEAAGTYACQASAGGCSGDTAFFSFTVTTCPGVDGPLVEIPNVITPNGDGINDVFRFAGDGFEQAELHVRNRWGQQVAVVVGRNASWDGRNTYSGEMLGDGVYFYTIEATLRGGGPFRKAGCIHLFR